jgi:hypothetical protein
LLLRYVDYYVNGRGLTFNDEDLKAFQFNAWGATVNHSASVVESMNWQILKSQKGNTFITSDGSVRQVAHIGLGWSLAW